MSITLTNDQSNAFTALTAFMANPAENAFVLSGYAGTGKSTMIRYVLDELPKVLKTLKLVNPSIPVYDIQLTATTNKAADNLAQITGEGVPTIHSFLGLRVQTDYVNKETKLIPSNKTPSNLKDLLLFIDEASYVDKTLLYWIRNIAKDCKIIFIGDPAQLIPVKASNAPVFTAALPGAALKEVVRQAAGNPVLDLATKFRETVSTGQFFSFKPDGKHVVHMSRDDFNQAIEQEFIHGNGQQTAKILAWTNGCVEAYNKGLAALNSKAGHFHVGDYVQCNKFFRNNTGSIKTDELVLVTDIGHPTNMLGVPGRFYTVRNITAFCADSLLDKKNRLKKAHKENDYDVVKRIEEDWIDLREVYACTINKSQGSTYDKVFIDLDDLKKCNSGDQIARLLYVAVSRARHQVVLTGDLV